MNNSITKERPKLHKRHIIFAVRFAVLALVFIAFKWGIPNVEAPVNIAPPEDISLAIISSEIGIPLTETPSFSKLCFDIPFSLPTVDAPQSQMPPVSEPNTKEPSDESVLPDAELPGSLFYIPNSHIAPGQEDFVPENDAVETTITGEKSNLYFSDEGIYFKNNTEYDINVSDYLTSPLSISADSGAEVLIIHTHGSESYAMEAGSVYEESDPSRTTDKNFNVVHVGDVLADVLEERGISVIHDRELYDYPNYNGAYNRSYDAIQKHLKDHPNIQVVIDLHRDALEGDDGTVYKTVADIDGETCSQVMLIVGSDWSGLTHPNWKENLTFGFKLQKAMADNYPTLARPLKISQYRYNQQATVGSLIAEIGCNGNTLSEAVRAVEYFGDCLASVLGK